MTTKKGWHPVAFMEVVPEPQLEFHHLIFRSYHEQPQSTNENVLQGKKTA